MKNRFYRVTAPMGHQGTNNAGEITFHIKATCMSEAVCKAMKMPGVKHDRYALKAKEISYTEFQTGMEKSAYEKYKKDNI